MYRGDGDIEADGSSIGEGRGEGELSDARSVGVGEGLLDGELSEGGRAKGDISRSVLDQDFVFNRTTTLILTLLDAKGRRENVALERKKTFEKNGGLKP